MDRLQSSPKVSPGDVVAVGVPLDANSSWLRGAARGPAEIRRAFACESSNLWTETGIDLGANSRWHLWEDLSLEPGPPFVAIERSIAELQQQRARVIALGGDHSITLPVLRATATAHSHLTVLHIDAHADLYDEFEGSRESHACPFARVMEEGLVGRLVQVGIRTLNGHQREQAARFGVEVHELKDGLPESLDLSGDVYLSLDLDGLDPAFAPGVSHPEPGGLSTREVIRMIHSLQGQLVGADIVELNPQQDPQGLTAMVAARLLKEIAGVLLTS